MQLENELRIRVEKLNRMDNLKVITQIVYDASVLALVRHIHGSCAVNATERV